MKKIPYQYLWNITKKYVDKRIINLTNTCFVKESMAGRYFSGYASIFAINDFENFRFNPGLFMVKRLIIMKSLMFYLMMRY